MSARCRLASEAFAPGPGQVPDEMGLLTGSGVHLADAQVDHALGRVQNSLVELTLATNLPALRCECQTGM